MKIISGSNLICCGCNLKFISEILRRLNGSLGAIREITRKEAAVTAGPKIPVSPTSSQGNSNEHDCRFTLRAYRRVLYALH
jgi:hypothetical protein